MPPFVATSTLGMAAYNALAVQPHALSTANMVIVVSRLMQHEIDEEQLGDALAKLIELERIKLDDEGRYTLVAHEPLLVVTRDRSDYDPETGEGGWNGWRVKDPRITNGIGHRPLEHLIGQEAT